MHNIILNCGLNVIISYDESNSSIIYNIDGDVNGNDLKLIAKKHTSACCRAQLFSVDE